MNLQGLSATALPAIGEDFTVDLGDGTQLFTTVRDIDSLTGIPFAAIVPFDTSFLGNTSVGSGWNMKINKGSLLYLWFTALEFTVTLPTSDSYTIPVDSIFQSYPPNPFTINGVNAFAIDQQSFFFPLQYSPNYSDGSSQTGISISDQFFRTRIYSDGNGGYFPEIGQSAGDFTSAATTFGTADIGVAGTLFLQDINGAQLGQATLFSPGTGEDPYGDITIQVTNER